MITTLQYAERYLLARDVTTQYAALTRTRLRRFTDWCGGDFAIRELESDRVNHFLAAIQDGIASRVTVDNYRRAILAIWRSAYLDRENDNPPFRVRMIRKPRRIVTAFTREEIRAIAALAESLRGYFPNGVRRADFWMAIIHAAYSTGLRRGDLLSIAKAAIRTDGIVTLTQSKTGYPISVMLSNESLDAIRRMPIDEPRAFPWPYHENALPRQFRALVKSAGVRPGQFKWIRATAGSYAEQAVPGNGPKMLGHRSASVFRNHYEDVSITQAKPVSPPPL